MTAAHVVAECRTCGAERTHALTWRGDADPRHVDDTTLREALELQAAACECGDNDWSPLDIQP